MADLRDLGRNMRVTARAVGDNATAAVREVSEKVGVTVVYGTPVDTSRARMNWQGSVGEPAQGVLAPYPSQPAGPNDGPRVAIASIRAATADYDGQKDGVFITNNLDYIQDLNNGSSSQAPADFVAQAVLVGARAASKVKILP